MERWRDEGWKKTAAGRSQKKTPVERLRKGDEIRLNSGTAVKINEIMGPFTGVDGSKNYILHFNKGDPLEAEKGYKFEMVASRTAKEVWDEPQKSASVRLAKVRVNTKDYELSHARKPKGRGMWMFSIGHDPSKPGFDVSLDTFSYTGTYNSAVKAAMDEAKKVDEDQIWVLA